MRAHNLTPWEWITLVGVICASGVAVTVYALETFEIKVDADRRETRLERRLDRVEELQIHTLKALRAPVPPPAIAHED